MDKAKPGTFEPIAIVGRGCVLPGALTPDALWDLVIKGRDLVAPAPAGHWGAAAHQFSEPVGSDKGGYVEGFDAVFDVERFAASGLDLQGLDPLFRWLLYCAEQALDEAGVLDSDAGITDVVVGNLSYPTRGFSDFAEQTWLSPLLARSVDANPINRFTSGYPAHLVAHALGLRGSAFCLDAACSSSLYAIKIACERLHDRKSDLALAGGINRADDLFLHVGFTALKALSPSGQSRPFHRDADGLLPAEGASLIALKRLADAERDGNRILGVIRGIGVSNDGRQQGFLMPSTQGQIRAMQNAYDCAGIEPSSISYVECHATGTAGGDAVEIASMAEIFGDSSDVPVGSLKSNFGHLITASGAASILKVISAMEAEELPPTLHADTPIAAFDGTPMRPILHAEPWQSDGVRRAAINNFGFGGNNAHLIVEQWEPSVSRAAAVSAREHDKASVDIAVCGIGVSASECPDTRSLARKLFAADGESLPKSMESLAFPRAEVRFPPIDLENSLAQQTLMIGVSLQAIEGVNAVDQDRMGVFVGMGCDTEISRYGLRWRLEEKIADVIPAGGEREAWLARAQDIVRKPLTAANVVGSMPNIVANRLNAQFDWQGQGFSVSSEELSGMTALDIALRALRAGEIDAALVGAVDVCVTNVHERAAMALLPTDRHQSGDAAVAMVLKRAADAERDGDRILALIHSGDDGNLTTRIDLIDGDSGPTRAVGHAHAASGLLHVAAATLACAVRMRCCGNETVSLPWLAPMQDASIGVRVRAFTGQESAFTLQAAPVLSGPSAVARTAPTLRLFSGPDRAAVLGDLKAGREGSEGSVRLAIVAHPHEWEARKKHAEDLLSGASEGSLEAGVYFRDQPINGELAFVFTGAAGAYPGMGRGLLSALPEVGERLAKRFPVLCGVAHNNFTGDADDLSAPVEQLKGCVFLCQAHAEVSRSILKLKPSAAIGLSSGETNSLFAFGAWRDMDAMFDEIDASGMYGTYLTGDCRTAAQSWGDCDPVAWRNWRLLAPVAEVEKAVAQQDRVRITIINAPNDCVIGGDAQACRRVIETIGRARAVDLRHDMVVHCPEMEPFADAWRKIHDRKTHPVKGIRFYANALGGAHYEAARESATEALLGQALNPIDFPRTIEAAWNDGVRIFVEHGPRNVISGAIGEILGEREHLAVALDIPGQDDTEHLFHIAAQLAVVGVDVDIDALRDRFHIAPSQAVEMFRLPAHPPAIVWPPLPQMDNTPSDERPGQTMSPAPVLPSVADFPPVGPLPLSSTGEVLSDVLGAGPHVASGTVDYGAVSGMLAHMTALHRDYLVQQNRMYMNFLSSQQAILNGTSARSVTTIASPVMTAAAPVSDLSTKPVEQPAPVQSPQQMPPFPSGPAFGRDELEVLASGRVSSVLGPLFEKQDGYRRQVRLPEPPLLLVDRVTGIEGEPGTMGLGTIWTETDVSDQSWYLHNGRMPPGIAIESGQADLLLISWLGADFINQDHRVYRLLGCRLTFHEGGLPACGDTLRFDIHVDGHAKTGDLGLFFFHYDCHIGDRLMLSVRDGQAGFFTDQELLDSGGVLWDAVDDSPKTDAILDAPPCCTAKRSFDEEAVRAWVDGNAYACFGEGFEFSAAHQQTPTIPSGRLRMIDRVVDFTPDGGPWGRGYLRAETEVPVDSWFYDGHFLNDPCMPGTLMADAAVQALSFHMAALGFTIHRDGWRFEPMTEEEFIFVCRGQVVPDDVHLLTYEVFVEEIIDGDQPVVYASLLCSSDGFKVFHCRRFGVRLVPDWPLNNRRALLSDAGPAHPVGPEGDVRGDFTALLACAWGAPSEAFGSMYRRFDSPRGVPRLPGPPYHFVSRIVEVDCPPAQPTVNGTLIAEYVVQPDAWYFADNGAAVMPFSVLMETLLQPCGWLASYMGFALTDAGDLAFRNLDGDNGIQFTEVTPDSGTLRTHVTLTRFSRVGDMTLVFFRVVCTQGEQTVMTMNTSFGFFSPRALADQVGLSVSEGALARLNAASETYIDLRDEPVQLFEGTARLAGGRLRMIDAISGYWPKAGDAGLGRIRGTQAIRPDAWYFAAHFFQDPVQPGSLGLEALTQLLQAFIKIEGLDDEVSNGRFEAIGLHQALTWKYRGQVIPTNKQVVTELDITAIEKNDSGMVVTAKGSLWVDGLRIYEVENLAMRVVQGAGAKAQDIVLDMERSPWLKDHCPTYTIPALPMMSAVDYLATAAAAPGLEIIGLRDVKINRWVTVAGDPVRLRVEMEPGAEGEVQCRLMMAEDSARPAASPVATALVVRGADYPTPPSALPPLEAPEVQENLYHSGILFHGPTFQLLRRLNQSADGASYLVEAGGGGLLDGLLNPALLDAVLHGIPHDRPELWFGEAVGGQVAYPYRVDTLDLYGPAPCDGMVRVEARPVGSAQSGLVSVHLQAIAGETVWLAMTLTEVLLPKGPLGELPPAERRAFLSGSRPVAGVALSDFDGVTTRLDEATVRASNWLPGTLERVYRVDGSLSQMTRAIAAKEHVARGLGVHPSTIDVHDGVARADSLPLNPWRLHIDVRGKSVSVKGGEGDTLDLAPVLDGWRSRLNVREWPVEDIYFALGRRFINRIVMESPQDLAAVRGRPCLFLGNHQVGIESLLFALVGAHFNGRPIVTIAKTEHQSSWMGKLVALCEDYPGVDLPRAIMFFDRAAQNSMLDMVKDIKGILHQEGASLMVHAAGTRSVQCREPVGQLSGVFLDLAISAELPIVPLRFAGGLPVSGNGERLEFPVDFGKQDVYLGRPIMPEELSSLPLKERKDRVLNALNGLGPALDEETPSSPQMAFAEAILELVSAASFEATRAAVLKALLDDPAIGAKLKDFCLGLAAGRPFLSSNSLEDDWLVRLEAWFRES